MLKAYYKNLLALTTCCLVIIFVANGHAAITGTISGFVRDSESKMPLPNASILIEGTALGASADKSGFYVINNVPLGVYAVKAQMIGYVTTKITDVIVKTDQHANVDFELASQVLRIEPEIVITAPRNHLAQEGTHSIQHISDRDLTNNLPLGTFQDALDLLPGVVGNHFRGGRRSEVLYLVDGLPVNGAMTRELAFLVPNTSIAEMVVQTGGFSAEYGNAQAGVVNVVTKDGQNDFRGVAKVSTNTVGWEKLFYDNFQEAEFAIGGPFAASFGGPVVDGNYFLSSNVQATDTPFQNELRRAFRHPVKYNYNVNAKLALNLSGKIQLRTQVLGSRWNWHEYDDLWAQKLSAVPERDNRSLRLSASLTHTLTSKMFYTLSAGFIRLQHRVNGIVPEGASANIYLPDKSPAAAWPGATEPWHERLLEHTVNLRFNLVRQLHAAHQFSVGAESQIYDITFDRDRYLSWPLPSEAMTPAAAYVYSRYHDNIRSHPFTIGAFVQNRFKTNLLTVNLGVRYDVYNLTNDAASAPADTNSAQGSTSQSNEVQPVISPRLNLAFPLSDRSQVSINYGWFYQMPPLFYAYTNGSQNLESYWPLLGDTGLRPSRSIAYEASYRHAIARDLLFSVTGFWRSTDNLVDAVPVRLDGAEVGRGYARYANIALANSNGVEVQLQKPYSEGLSGFFHYTYLRAKGTASSAESGFGDLLQGRFAPRHLEVPLQWDQNHTFVLSLNFAGKGLNLNLLHRLDGPLKAFDSPLLSRPRLPWRYHLDLKLTRTYKTALGSMMPFIEARNLFDRHYPTMPDEGIPFNRANSPWQDRYGRSFRIGLTLQ